MTRHTWEQLPAGVRAAIEHETGTIDRIDVPDAGRNSDFSATLHARGNVVFCKGIAEADGKRGRMHRHEAEINVWLPPVVAPRLRWRLEKDGWLVLGFDHVAGRHANLSPGSADLAAVATTVTLLARELAGCPVDAPSIAEQWARLAPWRRLAGDPPAGMDTWTREHLDRLVAWEARAVQDADGDDLVHTDLHPLNILVSGERATVVDWAWSHKGAAVVDAAFLIARLVAAGHTPEDAARWAETQPHWRRAPATTRTALTVMVWGIWEYLRLTQPRPLWNELTPAARCIAHYFLGAPG